MADKQITVEVPEARVPEFYLWFAHFLAGPAGSDPLNAMHGRHTRGRRRHGAEPERRDWAPDDIDDAVRLYHKLSPPARRLFDLLIDAPGERFSGNDLAARLGIENGAHGIAGIVAWPGRWSRKLGRVFPITTDGREDGGTDYSMTAPTAELFTRARAAGPYGG